MNLKSISIYTIIVTLLGCSAAGVPYTSNPYKKISYSHQLMHIEGRGIAAEKLGLEALKEFEKRNDPMGLAESHFFLGQYYKNPSYRLHKNFYEKYREYDPTAEKSISHFRVAKSNYLKAGDYWGASKALFGMANAYATNSDYKSACDKYDESLEMYRSDKNKSKEMGIRHPFNQNFTKYDKMIEAFKDQNCKGNV